MKATGYGQTDLGLKRTTNEDSYLLDAELGLYMVCDGVSGHVAGDVASSNAVRIVQQQLKAKKDVIDRYAKEDTPANRETVSNLINDAVNAACSEIFKMAQKDERKHGMSTTLTLFLKAG